MKNIRISYRNAFALVAILMGVLLVPASLGQEQPLERGSVEIGVRAVDGDVYGRGDLPFRPSLTKGKFNEYRDLRTGMFLRSFQANFGGLKNYFNVQSQNSLLRDQSWLATVGQYGKYKVQFRYDETPHTFTNTARSLHSQTAPGTWTLAAATRTALRGYYTAIGSPVTAANLATAANNINAVVNSSASLLDTTLVRKTGTAGLTVNPTANWNLGFQFARERQTGYRPLAVSISGGNVEVPESIDYSTNNYKVQAEYGRSSWAARFGYQGSTFANNVPHITVDNPFVVDDASNATRTARFDLYPNNRADNLLFAGALDITKKVHVTASVVPGWMSQDDELLPYTTNTFRARPAWGVLPEASANARKQTLAMNYTITSRILKNVQVKASYRSYDYNNDTPEYTWFPVTTDGAYSTTQSRLPAVQSAFAFDRKTAELAATWFFSKKNSVKVGYEFETMDREKRDVRHTQENTVFAALDLNPHPDVTARVSYRHGNRNGEAFVYKPEIDLVRREDPNWEMSLHTDTRRFDEAARLRDRAEAVVQYTPLDALTLSASFGTTQDNYNRARANQAPVASNPFPGLGAFYTFGLLKDIGRYYTFDANYAVTSSVSVFAEYTREKYNTKMSLLGNANLLNGDLINAYANSNNDKIDTWAGGVEFDVAKRATITTFYSLSAAQGNMLNRPINCTLSTFAACRALPGWSLDTAALPLVTMDYPENVNRLHQLTAQVRFKLTKSLTPRFEYRFEQFDNRDFQTTVMNPYVPSMYDGANTWLFLGADNPSYHGHVVAASVEYRF
jgi:MtrB/PioB family decaheme-associated outer membrane protein